MALTRGQPMILVASLLSVLLSVVLAMVAMPLALR
jgi:hypothetical protein